VRLVAPDGRVVVDRERRLGGRGVYVCPEAACAERARRKGGLGRRFRASVEVPGDLAAQVTVEAATAAWKN
jgi:predicted RNA-binding protein YlxR (DUF448 family)